MPTHRAGTKDGKPSYQWGRQKRYSGKGAKARADKQGRAIRASQARQKKKQKK